MSRGGSWKTRSPACTDTSQVQLARLCVACECVALALELADRPVIPLPFLITKYGKKLRQRSRYTSKDD